MASFLVRTIWDVAVEILLPGSARFKNDMRYIFVLACLLACSYHDMTWRHEARLLWLLSCSFHRIIDYYHLLILTLLSLESQSVCGEPGAGRVTGVCRRRIMQMSIRIRIMITHNGTWERCFLGCHMFSGFACISANACLEWVPQSFCLIKLVYNLVPEDSAV